MATAKKVTKRKKVAPECLKLWLTRMKEAHFRDTYYEFWIATKAPKRVGTGEYGFIHPTANDIWVCPLQWEAFAPKKYHLKPHAGPIEVKLG